MEDDCLNVFFSKESLDELKFCGKTRGSLFVLVVSGPAAQDAAAPGLPLFRHIDGARNLPSPLPNAASASRPTDAL
jgi:hypothetical protein